MKQLLIIFLCGDHENILKYFCCSWAFHMLLKFNIRFCHQKYQGTSAVYLSNKIEIMTQQIDETRSLAKKILVWFFLKAYQILWVT